MPDPPSSTWNTGTQQVSQKIGGVAATSPRTNNRLFDPRYPIYESRVSNGKITKPKTLRGKYPGVDFPVRHETKDDAGRVYTSPGYTRFRHAIHRDRLHNYKQQPMKGPDIGCFLPGDGIEREVVTADICIYLGNDALVRPGNYLNSETKRTTQGYYVTAYQSLTRAMIEDLKADSERWDADRRALGEEGANSKYRRSTTHRSRQYYGPISQSNPSRVLNNHPDLRRKHGNI